MSDEVAKELETTLKGKLYLAPFNLINYVSVVSQNWVNLNISGLRLRTCKHTC